MNVDLEPAHILMNSILDPAASSGNIFPNTFGDEYQAIFNNQNAMSEILNSENARLNDKQSSVNLAKTSQDRMIELNRNYSERYNAYSGIFLIIILGLILSVIVKYLEGIIEIPEGIMTLLYVIIISVTIIYCIKAYWDILARDPIYFDQQKRDSPNKITGSTAPPLGATQDNADLLTGSSGDVYHCNNAGNVYWNPTTNLCVYDVSPAGDGYLINDGTTAGFQNMEGFGPIGLGPTEPKFVVLNQTNPYEISEMDNYSKYK